MNRLVFTGPEQLMLLEVQRSLAARYGEHACGDRGLLICVLFAELLMSGAPPEFMHAMALGLADGALMEMEAIPLPRAGGLPS